MSQPGKQDQFRLGFLTTVEDSDRGYMGGLLITNRFGRPLEFQCTTPVKPNRTQEILYGPTLRPYVLSELIGRTLIDKVSVKPHLLLAEFPELLELRDHLEFPVACFAMDSGSLAGQTSEVVKVGQQRLRFHDQHPADAANIAKRIGEVPPEADLKEPFDRIREALAETIKTQRIAG